MAMLPMTFSDKPQTTTISVVVVAFHIFLMGDIEISNLVHSLIVASPSPLMAKRP